MNCFQTYNFYMHFRQENIIMIKISNILLIGINILFQVKISQIQQQHKAAAHAAQQVYKQDSPPFSFP